MPDDYCEKRKSYLFLKLMFIGNICHFTNESKKSAGQYEGPYYNKTYIDQYLLKTSTGEIGKFKPKLFLDLIQDDIDLHTDYNSLSSGKKEKEIFRYILKYNNRNPLPIN